MTDTVVAALVTGIFSILSALITLSLAKDNAFYWRRKKTIRFSGGASVVERFSRDGSGEEHEQSTNSNYIQRLDNGQIVIAGGNAKMFADFHFTDGNGRSVTGKMKAEGRIHNDKAFLLYEIDDGAGGQDWHGVVMVYIGGIGDVYAHFITESFSKPGFSNFGIMKLNRR